MDYAGVVRSDVWVVLRVCARSTTNADNLRRCTIDDAYLVVQDRIGLLRERGSSQNAVGTTVAPRGDDTP